MARSWSDPEHSFNKLFRRCLECPKNVQPTCPECQDGESCALKPQTCDACSQMVCLKMNSVQGIEPPKKPTPVGGIVGGVVGGVVAIIVLTYLVWRFCIKKRNRQDLWVPPEKDATMGRSGTALSRTHSIASTVMTRASNVIQIAYIPGVTVRSAPESPEIAPPMPSIPSTYAGTSANTSPEVEQHFFMPKDLRDSVWSDASSIMTTDQRVSIAPSLMARDTIYQENVVVPPIPAQYAYRAQANAVSVKSGSNTPNVGPNSGATPPMPQTSKVVNITGSSIVARNVMARPIEVKKSSSANSVPTLGTLPKKAPSRRATPVPVVSDEKEVVFSTPGSLAQSETPMLSARAQQPSPMSIDGASVSGAAVIPAEGPLGSSTPSGRPTTAYTQAMIHEAMFRATQDISHPSMTMPSRPEARKHDPGPFSDANEIR